MNNFFRANLDISIEDYHKPKSGVDVKLLQYRDDTTDVERIDIVRELQTFFPDVLLDHNCIVINIEKDYNRYISAVSELKKVSLDKFVHLKATYWKQRDRMVEDMNYVLHFLKQFVPNIPDTPMQINEFSEINDININIQDGPLGCYCSHLRAMIYGYYNHKDYTIIIEDDITIVSTEKIKTYLKEIPDDWDIIFLNSVSKTELIQREPYHKLIFPFHSAHFYIVKNSSMPKLFAGMYPIIDQVDVLISNMRNELNIYNISDTVYQKSISTNTQNNLYVIHASPNYDVITIHLDKIQKLVLYFVNTLLPDNKNRNEIIASNLIFDIIYHYIISYESIDSGLNNDNIEKYDMAFNYAHTSEYQKLYESLLFVIQCCRKGTHIELVTTGLINNIMYTLRKFILHNTIDVATGCMYKAYDYGATSHTYALENNTIVKVYDAKLRWASDSTSTSESIFVNEINLLAKIGATYIKSINADTRSIVMVNKGVSLYDNFNLPDDWMHQLERLFERLDADGIYYPEFRLQNILIKDGVMTFIDFGLARSLANGENNHLNCEVFGKLLGLMNGRFKNVQSMYQKRLLYITLINNIKIHRTGEYANNIF